MNVNIMEKVTEEREKTLAFLLLNKCVCVCVCNRGVLGPVRRKG